MCVIRKFDVRKAGQEVLSLRGHEDTVTGLCVSPEGSHLLSNAMDHSLRSWDIRAFVTSEDQRCEKIFQGARVRFSIIYYYYSCMTCYLFIYP